MTKKNYGFAFGAVITLFFIWGFITVLVDAFIPRLKEVFELSYAEAGLVQVAWFLAYLLISIPGGAMVAKLGYKRGIVGGLLLAGLGCALFYPAASFRVFPLFLLALFVLASGITILQVAANPFVAVLGPERKSASRLNLAQAFNSLGTTLAPILSASYLLSDAIYTSDEINALSVIEKSNYYAAEAAAVQGPFLWIAGALCVVAIAFALISLPSIIGDKVKGSYAQALKKKSIVAGALGIFVYVGAEVAIGSYLTNYFLSLNLAEAIKESTLMTSIGSGITNLFTTSEFSQLDNKAIVGTFVVLYWGGAMLGRFFGAYLTAIAKPSKVLIGFGVMAIFAILTTIFTSGFVAMFSALSVGFFNSIMFPTIFTNTLDGLKELKPQASGILCTSIFGGAVIPPLFGLMTDKMGFEVAFILPILCYAYIIWLARTQTRTALQQEG